VAPAADDQELASAALAASAPATAADQVAVPASVLDDQVFAL
jgi:hypothetical protein